jgi:hypothetical protein
MSLAVTYFMDVDGVVTIHEGKGASNQWTTCPTLAPDVVEWFDEAERRGAYIILTTSRKESCRTTLEELLHYLGLFWDALIMGLPHGPRVLVNDVKSDGSQSAFAVNVPRNEGLANVPVSYTGSRRSDAAAQQATPADQE